MTDTGKPIDKSTVRVVRLKPSSYQPSKAEMEEVVTFPEETTPDDLVRAVVRPVRIVYEDEDTL